jgi:hypothetical protein
MTPREVGLCAAFDGLIRAVRVSKAMLCDGVPGVKDSAPENRDGARPPRGRAGP